MLPIWQFNYTALLGSYLLIPGNINCFHKRQNELAFTNCVYELTKQLRQCIKGNNQIFSGRYKASPPSTKELHGYAFGGPQQGYILPCLCGTSSIVIPLASHYSRILVSLTRRHRRLDTSCIGKSLTILVLQSASALRVEQVRLEAAIDAVEHGGAHRAEANGADVVGHVGVRPCKQRAVDSVLVHDAQSDVAVAKIW